MSITKTITYTCSDGTTFNNEAAAFAHEQDLANQAFLKQHNELSDQAAKWLRTSYSGQRLMGKHRLDETGFWHIKGEDPNCDFGGHHYQPDLGVVQGKLSEVVNYAVRQNRFYTWGAGGDITKISITEVSSV